ncbi:MAG TPA: UvrD-helicase domain-containing protein [Gemmatimonadaceae bacterium]|jgi:DNA helicase-2/ATP-dependent DNA helicase PcrA|nr:UvrD-helicase domain-containing protein [Gemmatimonadaceae bacterium]
MPQSTDNALLEGLNAAQREAVLHHEGPLLVLAGAGSGKTRVLTRRLARLIQVHGVRPSQILAVTFTNKAAGEMRERIAHLLGAEPAGLWAGTFHAIGARLLRRSASLVGRTPAFTIYDEDDAQALLKRAMERRGVLPRQYAPRAVRGAISEAKNALVAPAEFAELARDPFARAVAEVYADYEDSLLRANAADFDDLLVLPVRMLEANPAELERLRDRFRYLLVDEYQDTNRAQYRLIALLGGGHHNVCVVGDDDQSIYGWRGADIRNILDFEKDFPAATVVRLEDNYRSTPPILDLANVVIAQNTGRMGKTLRATCSGGDRVVLVRTLDERDEADWVVEELRRRRTADGGHLRDFAVLYRTNAQSRAMEEALRRHGVPYRLIGAVRFYDRREIRDLMAYLKLVANPADDEAFRRAIAAPRRGVGDATVELLAERARSARVSLLEACTRADLLEGIRPATRDALAAFAELVGRFRELARETAVDELLQDLVEAIKYPEYLGTEGPEAAAERMDNVRELIAGASETVADAEGEVGLTPLDVFLQRAALVADIDQLDADADAVTLMTLHNAKGLEFPVVFIAGLEDGLFPLARAYEDPEMLEEERRLFYVGITRAQRHLYLLHAESRRRHGEFVVSRASSFLDGMPESMLEEKASIKVRASGRGALLGLAGARGLGAGASGTGRGGSSLMFADDIFPSSRASARRPGQPVRSIVEAEDESQDAATIVIGARVRHRKFGSGTIAEIAGAGMQTKVRVDFDDEGVGRKTLVVAQANLERELE